MTKNAPPRDGEPGLVYDAITRLNQVITRPDVRLRLLGPGLGTTTVTESLLLRLLSRVGPIRVSDLAALQGVDKSTISPQVARLERAGLVEREGDPEDGRAVLVRVSAQGRTLLRRSRASAGRVYAEATADWSDRDRDTLGRLAIRLAEAFEELAAAEA